VEGCGLDSSGSGQGPLAGCFERGVQLSGTMTDGIAVVSLLRGISGNPQTCGAVYVCKITWDRVQGRDFSSSRSAVTTRDLTTA
jgi:hypothetical protein